ncbi:MAG: hypothetical protein ACI4GD_00185 [Lachnospiraceae bacterium]
MADEIYYCEACGGIMEFDVKTQALKCPNCDTVVQIANNSEDIVEHTLDMNAINKIRVEEKTTVTMVCSGCGAPIEVESNSTALSCPYCGSSYVIADKQAETIVPDGVVTFKITVADAKDIFRNWIKKRYLAPNALKNLYQHGKFQGMYIPYWTFDADAHAYYRAMGGRNRTETYKDSNGNTHTRTVTDWYATTGNVRRFFDDVLVCASERNDKILLNGIDNYDTKNMPSYSPDYLSGYGSEVYSVDLKTGHDKAIRRMSETLRSMAADDVLKRYDAVKDVRIDAHFNNETYKHVLVPVYSTNYSFKGKNYTVLINGENGAIKGEYPKSVAKIVAIIVAAAAALILIFSLLGRDSDYYEKNDYNSSTLLCEECDEIVYEYEMPEDVSADFMEV